MRLRLRFLGGLLPVMPDAYTFGPLVGERLEAAEPEDAGRAEEQAG
jgi:hypothetical protein